MADLFGRRARVTIGPPGETATVIDSGTRTARAFRIAFSVEKTIRSSLNEARVRVWNLADSTRERIRSDRNRFAVEAGYEDTGLAVLFRGQVTHAESPRDGVDRVTTIECLDGYDAVKESEVYDRRRSTYTSGPRRGRSHWVKVGWKQPKSTAVLAVVKGLAEVLTRGGDVTLGDLDAAWTPIAADATRRGLALTLPKHREFNGRVSQYLDEYGRQYHFDWSLQDGVFEIHPWSAIWRTEVVNVSKESGLVGVPAKAQRSVKVEDDDPPLLPAGVPQAEEVQVVDGVTFSCLLRPELRPGVLVLLESEAVEGMFRVETCRYEGDTTEGAFGVEVEAWTIPGTSLSDLAVPGVSL